MKRTYFITETNRQHICEQIMSASAGDMVQISEPTRTLEQNALMWPYLECFSKQLPWPVMIAGQWQKTKLSTWDWKDFLTGSFEGDARRMAMGIDGNGLVMLGAHTSGYGKKKFSDFIEFMNAFGAQQNVDLRNPQQVLSQKSDKS